jgi:uroporphyrinogen-III synthase
MPAPTLLITRPEPAASRLAAAVRASTHYQPLLWPAFTIQALSYGLPADLASYQLLIFTSVPSVEYIHQQHPQLWQHWPACPTVAAIGPSTAAALQQHFANQCPPIVLPATPPYDSQSLLGTLQAAQLQHARCLIVTGADGHQALGQALPHAMHLYVYQRVINTASHLPIATIILASCNTCLQALENIHDLNKATPLLVVSQRIGAEAKNLGWQNIHYAASASDADIVAALKQQPSSFHWS